jgi:hypothetical protein
MNLDLVSAVFSSMALAVAASFVLTFASILALAAGYRSDLMKARRGLFAAFAKNTNNKTQGNQVWAIGAATKAGVSGVRTSYLLCFLLALLYRVTYIF